MSNAQTYTQTLTQNVRNSTLLQWIPVLIAFKFYEYYIEILYHNVILIACTVFRENNIALEMLKLTNKIKLIVNQYAP